MNAQTRVVGWQAKLNEYLLSIQQVYKDNGGKIVWGQMDCVHFVGDWIKVCTNTDVIAGFRGRYGTEEQAFELLSREEGTMLEALTHHLGQPIHPAQALRGDIAFHEQMGALGIFFTSGSKMQALFLGRGGFAMHKLKDVTHAFRVGAGSDA